MDDKSSTSYYLPDGTTIKLAGEKYEAPEILFNPEKIGLECMGVQDMIASTIKSCDIDLRKELVANVITAGGTTLLKGFSDRLHKSLTKIFPKELPVSMTYVIL